MKERGLKFSTLKSATIGGAAVPPAMVRTLEEDFGLKVLHGWGMTEMSPVGTINTEKAKHRRCRRRPVRALAEAGAPAAGVEMKIVDADGAELPWDGKARGNLLVRGPWVLREYFRAKAAVR
jgi:fatty-acyl-CoA synthase